MTVNPWRAGLALAAAVGFFHLLWSALVACGAAQPVLAFILRVHFLQLPLTVAPFEWPLAVALFAVTAVIGFLCGAVFAGIWNWMLDSENASPR